MPRKSAWDIYDNDLSITLLPDQVNAVPSQGHSPSNRLEKLSGKSLENRFSTGKEMMLRM